MESALVAGALLLGLIAATWLQYRSSRGRMWDPIWLAFSMTFAAILFVVAGAAGFRLERRVAVFSDARWSDAVIWWQVQLGVLVALIAVLAWRAAIRETDRRLRKRSG